MADRVGQLFVMGITATGATGGQLQLVTRTRVGAVILMGNSTAGISGVRQVTDAARQAGRQPAGVKLMVTADQEGGQVRRLQGAGFSSMPSGLAQGSYPDATLQAKARQWGTELKQAGVDVDLAPVTDVVPASIGDRNSVDGKYGRQYGSTTQRVAQKTTAFIQGMKAAGEGTTVKHFPGLGRVTGNTDFAAKVVDNVTTRHDATLGGFNSGLSAGADMIMVSTAYYTKIDSGNPAAFSPTVVTGMLRDDRHYQGVIISDDLGVAKAVAGWSPGQRAIRFIEAGGDLVTNVDPDTTDDMVNAVLAKAEADPTFAARVKASADRVLAMKAHQGLAGCHH